MSPKLLNILLALLPLVLYFGYIDPAYTGAPGFFYTPEKGLMALRTDNDQYSSTLTKIVTVEEGIKRVAKSYNEVDPELKKKVEIMLPNSLDTVKLRNEIVTIGNKAGVAVTGVKVEPDSKSSNADVNAYLVTFTFKAKYSTTKKFLELYEKNLRFFVLETIAIKHQEKKDDGTLSAEDPDTLSVGISSRVYSFK